MTQILYGDDDFTIEEQLALIIKESGFKDLQDVNIDIIDGQKTTISELIGIAGIVPFLSEIRLVIVKGLLSRFEKKTESLKIIQEWEGFPDEINKLPPSTRLVFVDGLISSPNSLLRLISPISNTQKFILPRHGQMISWIKSRASQSGITLENSAAIMLSEVLGNNLRLIDNELTKLTLYRPGKVIYIEDVEKLVSSVREANIFATVDAILQGKSAEAVRMIHNLFKNGTTASDLIFVISRQLNLLILTKDLIFNKVPFVDYEKQLGVSGYVLKKVTEQSGNFTMDRLKFIKNKLIDLDLKLKTTNFVNDDYIIDLFATEMSLR